MGPGWEPYIWENGGWHYRVEKGVMAVYVNLKQGGWRSGIWEVANYSAWINGEKQFICNAETPEDALGFATQEARSFIDRLQGQLAVLYQEEARP